MSTNNGQEWDVAVNSQSIGTPQVILRAFEKKGFNRAKVRITELGLLVTPYQGEAPAKPVKEIELPDFISS